MWRAAVVKICDSGKSKLKFLVSRRHAALREDPHHRQGNLSRQGHFRRQVGARSARRTSKRWATASSRFASPRRNTASRPIPTPRARRSITSSMCARSGCPAGAEFVVAVCGEDHDHARPARECGLAQLHRRSGGRKKSIRTVGLSRICRHRVFGAASRPKEELRCRSGAAGVAAGVRTDARVRITAFPSLWSTREGRSITIVGFLELGDQASRRRLAN